MTQIMRYRSMRQLFKLTISYNSLLNVCWEYNTDINFLYTISMLSRKKLPHKM